MCRLLDTASIVPSSPILVTLMSCALQDILSNKHPGGPITWPQHLPDFNHLDFYPWKKLKILVFAAPADSEEAIHYCIWMPVRLFATTLAPLNEAILRHDTVCTESH
jgi:hypothetical protein